MAVSWLLLRPSVAWPCGCAIDTPLAVGVDKFMQSTLTAFGTAGLIAFLALPVPVTA